MRTHLCIYMFLHRARLWSLNSFPEEQCLMNLSPSNTTIIWGSGGFPPDKVSLTKLSIMPENPSSADRRDGKSSV